MIIVNEPLLATFRAATQCEVCRAKIRTGLDPHHVFARGMGGGHRLDVPFNLVAICRTCHTKTHLGHIARGVFLDIILKRERLLAQENLTIQEIVYVLHWLKRRPGQLVIDEAST